MVRLNWMKVILVGNVKVSGGGAGKVAVFGMLNRGVKVFT
jgi:hypothetical protein